MVRTLKLNEKDNIIVFLEDGKPGDTITINNHGQVETIELKVHIPFGHKIAVRNIEKGEKIIKYGEVIGGAITTINKGEYAHTHNIESLRVRHDLQGEKI